MPGVNGLAVAPAKAQPHSPPLSQSAFGFCDEGDPPSAQTGAGDSDREMHAGTRKVDASASCCGESQDAAATGYAAPGLSGSPGPDEGGGGRLASDAARGVEDQFDHGRRTGDQ
jgi:hypothetical protein